LTDQELIAPELPEQKDPTISGHKSGWYKVARSEDIASMKAIQVDDFPTQIVIWRGEDLALRGLDLYCKHMGASLACGEVNENSIQCPFHAWRWAGNGQCDQIPYAKKIPDKGYYSFMGCN
jgi:3-ketosteroid 9alpha-monooxygenase subunit A